MLNIILIILFFIGIVVGLRRGLILQLLHLTGFIIAFIAASMYYEDLAARLELWVPYPEMMSDASWAVFLENMPLETAYYNAIAFGIIFFIAKIILQIVATMLDFVADLPFIRLVNSILGAALGFLEVYLLSFIILYILALAPVSFIQELINHSGIAAFIIEQTPILSEKLSQYWFEKDPFN